MLNPPVLDIIERIKQLPSAYDENDLNPHLSKAIYSLEQYSEDIQQHQDNIRLLQLNQRIDTFLNTHNDAGITYVKEEHGPFKQSHTFNGMYGFYLNDASQLDALDTFLDFILVELLDQIDNQPDPTVEAEPVKNGWRSDGASTNVVTWNSVSEANWSKPVECTPSTEGVEYDSSDFHSASDISKVDEATNELPEEILLDPEAEALQKKKNVEHLAEVREGIDKMAEERRQIQLKIRTDAIAVVIANNHNVTTRLISVITSYLTGHTKKSVDLSEVIKEVLTHNFVNDLGIIRTMIKVVDLNLKSTLQPTPAIVIDSNAAIGLLPYSSKVNLAYIAICNLASVRAHESVRNYSVFELITYMLDYCEITSSLNITDTPEEIVELMSGVYDIFVSNALNPEFVYNSAIAQSTLMADTWYRANPIVTQYLSKIKSSSQNEELLKSIAELYNARNTLMSQQSLDREAVAQLRELLDTVWSTREESILSEYFTDLATYVIIARGVGPYEQVCIVIDDSGALSYAAKDTSMSYQKNYDVDQTAELTRWLNILL